MDSKSQRKRTTEPDRNLVESAIVEVLELANQQGITAAEFIEMLDRGMRMSDFLNAMAEPRDPDPTSDSDTAKSRLTGNYDS